MASHSLGETGPQQVRVRERGSLGESERREQNSPRSREEKLGMGGRGRYREILMRGWKLEMNDLSLKWEEVSSAFKPQTSDSFPIF